MASSHSKQNFNQRIWSLVEQIPVGSVCSYGVLADLAGYPRHARQVANALKAAPKNRSLPWHRVVAAGGRIAMPIGSPNRVQQIQRLRSEGVEIVSGRVTWSAHAWEGGLDAELWGQGHSMTTET